MRGVRSVLFLGCHVSEGDNVYALGSADQVGVAVHVYDVVEIARATASSERARLLS